MVRTILLPSKYFKHRTAYVSRPAPHQPLSNTTFPERDPRSIVYQGHTMGWTHTFEPRPCVYLLRHMTTHDM